MNKYPIKINILLQKKFHAFDYMQITKIFIKVFTKCHTITHKNKNILIKKVFGGDSDHIYHETHNRYEIFEYVKTT